MAFNFFNIFFTNYFDFNFFSKKRPRVASPNLFFPQTFFSQSITIPKIYFRIKNVSQNIRFGNFEYIFFTIEYYSQQF